MLLMYKLKVYNGTYTCIYVPGALHVLYHDRNASLTSHRQSE